MTLNCDLDLYRTGLSYKVCLDMVNILSKVQKNHSIRLGDIERTRKVNGQTDGRTEVRTEMLVM